MGIKYVFRVWDSNKEEYAYVVYTKKDNQLICARKEFKDSHEPLKNLESLIEYLQKNSITKAISFAPRQEKVCSHIDDEGYYGFFHIRIENTEQSMLKDKGIFVDILDEEKEKTINDRLRDYE